MKKKLIPYGAMLLLLTITNVTKAQDSAERIRKRMGDSIKQVFMTQAAIDNPILRPISISTDVVPKRHIRSYFHDKQSFDGKIDQFITTALANVNVKSWGKNSISIAVNAIQQYYHFSDFQSSQNVLTNFDGKSISKLTIGLTPNYLRVDSLFGKQVIYTLSASFFTDNANSVKRASYLGGAIFTLKQTMDTRTSVGLLINIDPSFNIPVLPVFSYWRKYKNGLELNINLPQGIIVKKIISANFWTTFGSSISGSTAFFEKVGSGTSEGSIYSTIDLKTGPGLEYRVGRKLIFGLKSGLISVLQARQFNRSTNSNNYFLKNKFDMAPFMDFSMSVLPFF